MDKLHDGHPRQDGSIRLFFVGLSMFCLGMLYLSCPTMNFASFTELSVHKYSSSPLGALMHELPILQQPPAYKSINGVLDITLRAQAARFTQGPVAFNTRTYNGIFPGPTLCAKPGDILRITLVNDLLPDLPSEHLSMNTMRDPNTTNLHVHGMHVSPMGISDNVLRTVNSGESMVLTIKIPETHQLGAFHYHPHHHGSTFLQMGGGMVGVISVQDNIDQVDSLLVLQSFTFSGPMLGNLINASALARSTLPLDLKLTHRNHKRMAELYPEYQPQFDATADNHPPFYIINGQYQPRIQLRNGERKLFQLINAGPTQMLEIFIPGCTFEVLAKDAFPPSITTQEYVIVSPGVRVAIVVECHLADGETRGVFPLVSTPHNDSLKYMGRFTGVYHGVLGLFEVHEAEEPVPELILPRANKGKNLMPLTDKDEHIERFHVTFSSGPPQLRDGVMYKSYLMNNRLFSLTERYKMRLNVLHEWTLENVASPDEKNHPFHLHSNPFQVVAMTHGHGLDYSPGDWRDTITLPYGGNTTIRFRPTDYLGLVAAHCHILGHADVGMGMLVEITP